MHLLMSNNCFSPDYGAKRGGVVPKGGLADREAVFFRLGMVSGNAEYDEGWNGIDGGAGFGRGGC